ncbi:serine hydrolase [Nonomuraea sp. NPDC050328]|uniref:serine hydrolase n=1 Tax=Nonomuraea sp. NPDC050328 TaxID=3364361 RepID=UPI00378A15AE
MTSPHPDLSPAPHLDPGSEPGSWFGGLAAELGALAAACPGTLAVAVDGGPGVNGDLELPLASTGKLLLLAETAMGLDAGALAPDEPVDLLDEDYCPGSGLLTGLSQRRWTVADLALLTAAVSDNTATNALLRRIGLARVNAGAAALGLARTRLLDRIREPRLPEHPPAFALGTAAELARLAALAAGDAPWARIMLGWMAANTDRGLAAALVPHDPEARAAVPGEVWVANKTGTDVGTRADVGVFTGRRRVAYAVLASGPPGSEPALVDSVRQAGLLISHLAT